MQGGNSELTGLFDDLLQSNKFSSTDYKQISSIMGNKTAAQIFEDKTGAGTRSEDYKKLVELLQKYKDKESTKKKEDDDDDSTPSRKPKSKKCKSKTPTSAPPVVKAPTATCKNAPIEMDDYIRKDSIPCWACNLK